MVTEVNSRHVWSFRRDLTVCVEVVLSKGRNPLISSVR